VQARLVIWNQNQEMYLPLGEYHFQLADVDFAQLKESRDWRA
jgi:hypothetical protein